MAGEVRSVAINVTSSFVTHDAQVEEVGMLYHIDLEEFAERYGESFRSFFRKIARLHKLPGAALASMVVCYFQDPHDWIQMSSPDDFLAAVYTAMQQPDRKLVLQVYMRHTTSQDAEGDIDGKEEAYEDAPDTSRRVAAVADDDAAIVAALRSSAKTPQHSPKSRLHVSSWNTDAMVGPGTRRSKGRDEHAISSSASARELVADLAMLSRRSSSEDLRDSSDAAGEAATKPAQAVRKPVDVSMMEAPGERLMLTFPVAIAQAPEGVTFTSISIGSVVRSKSTPPVVTVYWADARQGLIGSYQPSTGRVLMLLDDLSIPTRLQLVDRRLYFVEEGGVWRNDGRLSYMDLETGHVHRLLVDLDLPHGLHVTPKHDVYFTHTSPESDSGMTARGSGYRFSLTAVQELGGGIDVCLLRSDLVQSSVPGMNPHLSGKFEVVLHRSAARGGLATDLAILPTSGQLLLGFRKTASSGSSPRMDGGASHRSSGSSLPAASPPTSPRQSPASSPPVSPIVSPKAERTAAAARDTGVLEQYLRAADGVRFDGKHNIMVMRRRPAIAELHVNPRNKAVYCCGWGGPPEALPVAVARARTSTPQDFVALRYGAAVSVGTDTDNNVYFLNEKREAGEDGEVSTITELRVILSHAERRTAARSERVLRSAVAGGTVLSDGKEGGEGGKDGEEGGKEGGEDEAGGSKDDEEGEDGEIDEETRRRRWHNMSVELSHDSIMAKSNFNLAASGASNLDGLLKDLSNGVNVQVVLRCRPLFAWEKSMGAESVITCRRNEVEVSRYAPYVQRKAYLFHRVLDERTTQRQVFGHCIAPIVSKAIQGYNCTVFAYGQTGTGKTFTLEGDMKDISRAGIIPRSIHDVFQHIAKTDDDFTITVSHLEIYNEELADLLSADYGTTEVERTMLARSRTTTSRSLWAAAKRRGIAMQYISRQHLGKKAAEIEEAEAAQGTPRLNHGLRIVKDAARGVIVDGLTEIEVTSAEEIFDILARSIKKRVTHETQMNKHSSRSHAIFTIQIASTHVDSEGVATKTVGRLNLVDLSGSENLKRSGSVGDRLREASHINQGLLSLGRVIKGIVEKAKYIPYRDSKLTRLLEESLGGNSVTLMILTVSPNSLDCDETVSTLNYANMAKMIFNTPKENKKVVSGGKAGSGLRGGLSNEGKGAEARNAGPIAPTILPWEGAVPIRKRRAADDGQQRTPRLYHATSVEWVEKHFLATTTGMLSEKAVAVLSNLFRKYDNGDKGYLSPQESRSLAVSIELGTAAAEKALNKAIKQVDDLDVTVERERRGRRSKSPLKSGRPPRTKGSRRPESAKTSRPKVTAAASVILPTGAKLPFLSFLAYAHHMAKDKPYLMCQLMLNFGYGMSLDPQRAKKDAGAAIAVPVQSHKLSLGATKRWKPAPPSVLRSQALGATEQPEPVRGSVFNILSWVELPEQSRPGSRQSSRARPSSAMPKLRSGSVTSVSRDRTTLRPGSARPTRSEGVTRSVRPQSAIGMRQSSYNTRR